MTNKIVYMLSGDEGDSDGPFLGVPDIDFSLLASKFRAERYAQCEAERKDYCHISESDFVSWLLATGVLSPLKATEAYIRVDTSGENAYVPQHWPLCPQCGVGRGEEEMGRLLEALNRREWYRKCTECRHTWAHHDEPYYFDKPMLEDDGRCIAGGCVPYSLSQTTGLDIDEVLEACRERGWREGEGMDAICGIETASALGFRMVETHALVATGKLTLRKLLDTLSPAKSYIVATRGHWLAVVNGENRDQADTNMRAKVIGCWEVQRCSVSA